MQHNTVLWHDEWYNMIKWSIIWYSAMCDAIWLRIHRPRIHWRRLQSNFLWWNVCLPRRRSAAHNCFHQSAGQVMSPGIPNGLQSPCGVSITPAFLSAKTFSLLTSDPRGSTRAGPPSDPQTAQTSESTWAFEWGPDKDTSGGHPWYTFSAFYSHKNLLNQGLLVW